MHPYLKPIMKSTLIHPRKRLVKRGTISIAVVESTPVVWKGKLLRFEWVRSNKWGRYEGWTLPVGCYHFVDMDTETEFGERFAYDHSFGSAYVENDTMYVNGVRGGDGGTNIIDFFESKDLLNWELTGSIELPEELHIYNTSCCKAEDGYTLAIEIGGQSEIVGRGFTIVFARSKDLRNWEMMDMNKHVFDRERYTACPVLRYYDGMYYMIHLEAAPYYRFFPYIVRSSDLIAFEPGITNPVMFPGDEDKVIIHPERFTEEQIEYILSAADSNNSDVDLCEYNGKTVITYSWGGQSGKEFLGIADYDGTEKEFLQSFFP